MSAFQDRGQEEVPQIPESRDKPSWVQVTNDY